MPQSFDDVLGIIVKRYKRNVDEKAFLKDQLVLIFFPSFIDFFCSDKFLFVFIFLYDWPFFSSARLNEKEIESQIEKMISIPSIFFFNHVPARGRFKLANSSTKEP